MYPPMWPYNGQTDASDRAMDAQAWANALTRAILRKDADAARALFDHTFWHKTDFKPDWFHLYVAVQQGGRTLVQLMVTYGARWDAQQTAIAAKTFGEGIRPFKYILAEGGMHIDAPRNPADIDPLTVVAMNRRILAENARGAGPDPAAEAAFNLSASQLCAVAALRGDKVLARRIEALRAETSGSPLDITPLLCDRLRREMPSFGVTEVLSLVDALAAAGVQLAPVALDRLPEETEGFYRLVAALETRGLRGGDTGKLRENLWRRWCYLQEKPLGDEGAPLHLSAETLERLRAECAAAAAVLCRADGELAVADVRIFTSLHRGYGMRQRDAVAHMDETLLAGGFFTHRAFDVESLEFLAQSAPTARLREVFSRHAEGRAISARGIRHFLVPKRFDALRAAMRSGAFVPDAQETCAIVTYLHGRCTRSGVPDDVTESMRVLRDCGANFARVDPLRYMGARHPQLAQVMLDLGIIRARDISRARLTAAITPHTGLDGMFARSDDKDYARREFLYQILLDRDFPSRTARPQGTQSYQRAYFSAKLRQIFEQQRRQKRTPPWHAAASRRGPRPGY